MKYTKSEVRIINNAVKMVEEVKRYHERTQTWDIPEHLIVDGCKVGKWWIDINRKVREGTIPDDVVHLLIEEKIDCGTEPLYQEEWYRMVKRWKKKNGDRIYKNAHIGDYRIDIWYDYFLSYRGKERTWLSHFDKFKAVWQGKKPISSDLRIGSKSVKDWALEQIQNKELSFWQEDMLDEIGFIWNEQKLLDYLEKRIVRRVDEADSKRLQQYVDEGNPAGITFIDVLGFVTENKGDIPWSGNGLFRCDVGINSIFTDKQYMDYVMKMKKEIGKRVKEVFARYAQNAGVTLTSKDMKIHRMVASKKAHRIYVLIRVTKVVKLKQEQEDEEDLDEAG